MGVVAKLAAIGAAAARPLIGRAVALPPEVAARYPELANARWRRGGLPVRVGGWCLGQATVSAITLWRTIWLAPHVDWSPDLLLHECRHVQQFDASLAFPVLYLWESLRRGYVRNRFEVDARAYAAARLRERDEPKPRG
jgi:hypothetical protein